MLQLFASDMDGTLLDNQHQINAQTADAVKAWQASGREFMIATGRDYKSASQLLAPYNIQCAMINLNGAIIHDENGQVLAVHPMPQASLEKILNFLKDQDLVYTLSTKDAYYHSDIQAYLSMLGRTLKAAGYDDLTQAQVKDHIKDARPIQDYLNQDQDQALKMMVISDNRDLLKTCKDYIQTLEDIDITSSGPDNIELTSTSAQKGLALATYLQVRGYQMDQVVTIGDSLNDRSMLAMCPNSYAMANASDQVKAMAANIAPANDQDGVAQVIDALLASD
ncbi:TPA: HAD family hydrolase [Streptococcus suis]